MSGLNLAAIEDALREFQLAFTSINRELDDRREPLDDEVVVNMIEGYALVNELLTERIDLFAWGGSPYWLKINAVVLCGRAGASAESNRRMLLATESRFYDDALGGFRELMDWYAFNLGKSVWWRASGVYFHLLSEPQLFLEGNHRTGALIISYMLAREGRPPFVLTKGAARGFLNPSSAIKSSRRQGLIRSFKLRLETRSFAEFLKAQQNPRFLSF